MGSFDTREMVPQSLNLDYYVGKNIIYVGNTFVGDIKLCRQEYTYFM